MIKGLTLKIAIDQEMRIIERQQNIIYIFKNATGQGLNENANIETSSQVPLGQLSNFLISRQPKRNYELDFRRVFYPLQLKKMIA